MEISRRDGRGILGAGPDTAQNTSGETGQTAHPHGRTSAYVRREQRWKHDNLPSKAEAGTGSPFSVRTHDIAPTSGRSLGTR